MTSEEAMARLREWAQQYETGSFIEGDPSWFMHQVEGPLNQEAMAFLASCFSYGSRVQFLPKINQFLEWSGGSVHSWVRDGLYASHIRPGDNSCFYRLNTNAQVNAFLNDYGLLIREEGSLGRWVERSGARTGLEAVKAICARLGGGGIVPQDAASACKRVCMFLRWMVRDGSPVDLGLWKFIDKRSLIIPMDTHVLQEACKLGLIKSRTASMSAALRLSKALAEVFPDDPIKGDFALFGYGVSSSI